MSAKKNIKVWFSLITLFLALGVAAPWQVSGQGKNWLQSESAVADSGGTAFPPTKLSPGC